MALSDELLIWYDRHRRHLPWRMDNRDPHGPDPYGVWLSEIMLQQTTVQTVIPYYLKFTKAWPTVHHLAAAPVEEVMQAWAGLGYYARARNLHACAQAVAAHGGTFPDSEAQLMQLPGIGPYTAAAIAAIAFQRPAVVMDGNVERVMARLFAIETPLPSAKPRLKQLAADLTPNARPGDYAQAVMDLGATICTPRSPACDRCPWSAHCQALSQDRAAAFPFKTAKPPKPTRHGLAFWLCDEEDRVLLRRRPPKGLLGGMMEFPSTPWRPENPWTLAEALPHAPAQVLWRMIAGKVHHTFTHFHLELLVVAGRTAHNQDLGHWCPLALLSQQALPTLMVKIADAATEKV